MGLGLCTEEGLECQNSAKGLREFQVKESSYEQLRTAGFPVISNWTTAPDKSDIVFESVRLIGSFKKLSYS